MGMFVIVVGGGKVGTYLAAMLLAEGYQVKVVEIRAEEIAQRQRDLPAGTAILGSGTDPLVLEAVGIRHADVVAAVTGEDEVNLVVTSLARFEFGVLRTIARVNNPRNAWMFTAEMGVDAAVNQADLMAHLIAEEMSLGDMMTLLKLRKGQYSLVEEKVDSGSPVVGKAVRDLGLPAGCTLAVVIHEGGQLISPRGDTVLQAGDELLAVVHTSQLKQLARLLGHAE